MVVGLVNVEMKMIFIKPDLEAITLWEPWATLVAYGYKQYETRSWQTQHRGPLLIHAARRPPMAADLSPAPIRQALDEIGIKAETDFHLGCGIAIVQLTGVYRTEAIVDRLTDQDLAFGDFALDRYTWVLIAPQRLKEPLPLRDQEGIWSVSDDVARRLRAFELAGVKSI